MYRIFTLLSSFLFMYSAGENLRGTSLNDNMYYNDNDNDDWKHFTNFQERFSKKYSSLFELETRFKIFVSNFHDIMNHNLDQTQNFTLGVNQFSDLTSEEFKSMYVSGLKSNVGSSNCKSFSSSASNAPDSIDWRNKGAVTSVKDQGQCGSCWSFSSTGAIEGAWAISKNQLVDLSEQELVDCATGIKYNSHGCNGGQMDGAFKFVIEHGQCADSEYPYTSGVSQTGGSCKSCSNIAHLSSCSDVKPNDQISLKAATAQQPVSIAIEADTRYFQSYSGGILDSASCGTNLDHGVLIVGYGEDSGKKYWLVKNSWGSSWGEAGYLKIARSDSTNDAGICGIAMDPSFPSV